MERRFQIRFTSDIHGYFLPTLYAERTESPMGLMKLMDEFPHDGNTLILDGGDTLQGSPLTNFFERLSPEAREKVLSDDRYGKHPASAMMNLAGYQYLTLGNHDFNYGLEELGTYLQELDAICLCANIRDKAGLLPIAPYAVHQLENGLRIGIAGICSHFVSRWEKPETARKLEFEDAFSAARRVLEELKPQCDMTILLYHGGYECDLIDGRVLSETGENQACRICEELDYDLVLTGHQHMKTPGRTYGHSYTMQPGYRALHACALTVTVAEDGTKRYESWFTTPSERANPTAMQLMQPLEARVQQWLDTPAGYLSLPLSAQDHLVSAKDGCLLANFVNSVQCWLSGARISTFALANEYKGLPRSVTIRDVVSTYIYSNTLVVLSMDRAALKAYMERSAAYFGLDAAGNVILGEEFTRPKVQHYNYDFFYGVDYTIDVRNPVGNRITSIQLDGREMQEGETVSVCVNSYRFGGTGGYEMVSAAPVLRDIQTDVADAIIDYISTHPKIEIDTHICSAVLPQ